ncbi:EamA family transporter, partial [Bacillus nitratireducens]|nr:EamA family transporter [Bacillus nitratireducens]
FHTLGSFCVIIRVLILNQKPDKGKSKLQFVNEKRHNIQ